MSRQFERTYDEQSLALKRTRGQHQQTPNSADPHYLLPHALVPHPGMGPAEILRLHQTIGNRAVGQLLHGATASQPGQVQRTITITSIDYNPLTQHHSNSTVNPDGFANALGDILDTKVEALGQAAITKLKSKIGQIGAQNLSGPDIPTLAATIAIWLVANAGLRNQDKAAVQAALPKFVEDALTGQAETGLEDKYHDNFTALLSAATVKSKSKATPNVVALASVPQNIQNVINEAVTKIRTKNQFLTNNNNLLDTAMDDLRSAHENGSGWLPRVVRNAPQIEQRLEPLKKLFYKQNNKNTAAAGTDLSQVPLSKELLQSARLTAKERLQLAWSRYAAGASTAGPSEYIEFNLPIVGRLIYDYESANGKFFITFHYNWHRGHNPFFEITGLNEV